MSSILKVISIKTISLLSYIFAVPYFFYATYLLVRSIMDKGLGGSLWSSGFGVWMFTFPLSLTFESIKSKDFSNPTLYLITLGSLSFIAIIINTTFLFFIGKGIYKLVSMVLPN